MKKGTPYEKLVALVISAFHPGATVKQGEWVEGPDGRRELDVYVEGKLTDSDETKLLIECKDFNPGTTGPVGIEYIDALDSKRRDLNIPYAIICSNSGFTDPSLRKAKRLGIGAVSLICKDNKLIKMQILEKNYYNICKLVNLNVQFHLYTKNKPDNYFDPSDVLYRRRPIFKWVSQQMAFVVQSNMDDEGTIEKTFRFIQPLQVRSAKGKHLLQAVTGQVAFKREWYSETVQLDAESAFRDWITGQLVLAPGENSIHIIGTNITADHSDKRPEVDPPNSVKRGLVFNQGQSRITYTMVEGVHSKSDEEIPPITDKICSEDLRIET